MSGGWRSFQNGVFTKVLRNAREHHYQHQGLPAFAAYLRRQNANNRQDRAISGGSKPYLKATPPEIRDMILTVKLRIRPGLGAERELPIRNLQKDMPNVQAFVNMLRTLSKCQNLRGVCIPKEEWVGLQVLVTCLVEQDPYADSLVTVSPNEGLWNEFGDELDEDEMRTRTRTRVKKFWITEF